jgi:hypothetical protein
MRIKSLIAPLFATLGLWVSAGTAAAQEPTVAITATLAHHRAPTQILAGQGRYGRTPRARYRPAPRRQWMPGHYEWVNRRVWISQRIERVWMQPVYEWRSDYRCGRRRVLVQPGYWREIVHPGHYEMRRTQVWRSGCWTTGRSYHPTYR